MSALAGLSVAANVLQIIGFADTVFRAGKSLYDVVENARSAARNAPSLLHELQALLSVVAFVRVVITEHASSPFAQADGHTLPNVHTILMLIEQDFRYLRESLSQIVASGSQSWLSTIQSNVRWALKDHEIAVAKHRLARYTQNLSAALSVIGRRNEIVLRTKLQSIEDRLQAISLSVPLHVQNPNVGLQPAPSGPIIRVPKWQSRAANAPLHLGRNRGRRVLQRDHNPDPQSLVDRLMSTPDVMHIDRVRSEIPNISRPNIKIYEQADQTLVFDTGNYTLYQFTKPAMLLQDALTTSFERLKNKSSINISEAQLGHLQKLFDLLVASAHTASADHIMQRHGASSKAKRYSQTFPSNIFGSKNPNVRRQGAKLSSISRNPVSTYLEEKHLSLDTDVGSVSAKVLIARCYGESRTLAFAFEYTSQAALRLSPFAIDIMAHELDSYSPLLQPLSHRTESFVFENGEGQLIEVPSNSLVSTESLDRLLQVRLGQTLWDLASEGCARK